MVESWSAGTIIAVRSIANSDGSVVDAVPARVIADDELLAVFVASGSIGKSNWVVPADERVSAVDSMPRSALRQHRDQVVGFHQLRLYLPGLWFSLSLALEGDLDPPVWYANLEAPFARTPIGIDTRDFALDVIGATDGRWRWKDEDEFARRLQVGLDSKEHQDRVRAAGQDFVSRLQAKTWPFDLEWESWRPEPEWELPTLSPEWATDFDTDRVLARAE